MFLFYKHCSQKNAPKQIYKLLFLLEFMKKIKREENKTYVYLIRHAHWDGPEKGPHKFNPNYPLSAKGRAQAKVLAKKLFPMKESVEVFFTSSMGRAKETAVIVSRLIKKQAIESNKLWEFNKILWTRKYYHYKYWKNYLRHKKTIREFNRILAENKGKVILIVAHGNMIKGILKNKQKLSYQKIKDMDYKNCHITLMKFNGSKLEKVHCFNSKEPIMIKN